MTACMRSESSGPDPADFADPDAKAVTEEQKSECLTSVHSEHRFRNAEDVSDQKMLTRRAQPLNASGQLQQHWGVGRETAHSRESDTGFSRLKRDFLTKIQLGREHMLREYHKLRDRLEEALSKLLALTNARVDEQGDDENVENESANSIVSTTDPLEKLEAQPNAVAKSLNENAGEHRKVQAEEEDSEGDEDHEDEDHFNSERSCSAETMTQPRLSSRATSLKVTGSARRSSVLVNRWIIGRAIGCGTYGRVCLCYTANTGETLAVKIAILHKKEHKEALEREIELLQNCQHENIVDYYGWDKTSTELRMFIGYMPGGSVYDKLKRDGPLTEAVTRRYSKQVLMALDFIHSKGIAHYDIKGANVLIDAHDNVKLCDFGCAGYVSDITEKKAAVGTIHWMAPEVMLQKGWDTSADIYSFGCLFVEMRTGNPPYIRLTMYQILKVMNGELVEGIHLPNIASSVERDLLNVVLQQDPQKRPSAEELLTHQFFVPMPPFSNPPGRHQCMIDRVDVIAA